LPTIGAMRRSQLGREGGQSTVEWTALLLVAAMLFSGLAYAVARTEAWGMGEGILHAIVCTLRGDCDEADALALAYGAQTAELVRRYSPNVAYERDSAQLPVDFRRCRKLECSNGPSGAAEVGRSSAGLPVTAFTRVVDRRPAGGALYVQHWFYYPESFSGGIGRIVGHRWPGYHADDWEGVQLMLQPDGRVLGRATAHGGYSGWRPWHGWYRVAGGSHAGEVVDGSTGERTTQGQGLELMPIERLQGLAALRFAVAPPWRKDVYRDPQSSSS
jgi:hypothetical protein